MTIIREDVHGTHTVFKALLDYKVQVSPKQFNKHLLSHPQMLGTQI